MKTLLMTEFEQFMRMGGTKRAELDRSAYLFREILDSQGAYFALMFLVDSGYNAEEIKSIAERLRIKH